MQTLFVIAVSVLAALGVLWLINPTLARWTANINRMTKRLERGRELLKERGEW